MPTPEEIAARRPVWIAMSDLFLDTDVRIWYPTSARTLAASPFTLDELDSIFRTEVRPALASNLFQVAGEWAGFDTEWLVSARLASRPAPPPRHSENWTPPSARSE